MFLQIAADCRCQDCGRSLRLLDITDAGFFEKPCRTAACMAANICFSNKNAHLHYLIYTIC